METTTAVKSLISHTRRHSVNMFTAIQKKGLCSFPLLVLGTALTALKADKVKCLSDSQEVPLLPPHRF